MLVEPELVVEVGVDVARDASSRWRHPHAGTAPGPVPSPADAQPTERAPIPGRPRHPALAPSSTPARAWSKGSQGGCQQPDHAKTAYWHAQMREGIYRSRNA